MTATCTVVTAAPMIRCGKPAVSTFRSARTDEALAECTEHHLIPGVPHTPPVAHPPTRTTRPYVLVRKGVIVGYAESKSTPVLKRAARLGAVVVAVTR